MEEGTSLLGAAWRRTLSGPHSREVPTGPGKQKRDSMTRR